MKTYLSKFIWCYFLKIQGTSCSAWLLDRGDEGPKILETYVAVPIATSYVPLDLRFRKLLCKPQISHIYFYSKTRNFLCCSVILLIKFYFLCETLKSLRFHGPVTIKPYLETRTILLNLIICGLRRK